MRQSCSTPGVPGAHQIVFVETMVDLDVELVIGVFAGSGGNPVVIDGWILHVRRGFGEHLHHLLRDGVDEVAGAP